MALVLKDRVKETSTTAGTGTLTLAGAVAGFQSFSAVGNGNTTYYAIVDNTTGDWEVGIGTYTASGTTLSRTTVLSSSNSGSLVSFTSNPKDVFVTYPAEEGVWTDASGVVNATSFGAITATSAALTTGTVSTQPSSNTDIANKQYVDTVSASGIHYHEPVYVESPDTAGNLNALYNQPGGPGVGVGATLTNNGTKAALTIDGVLMTVGKRVLIYNQTSQFQNGVYTVTTVGTPDPGGTNWVLTRATDADTYSPYSPTSLGQGDAFFVTNGDTGAGETYICNTVGTITFGTTAITFAQISDSTLYTAGTGLTLNGTEFSITPTGTAGTYGSASQVPVLTTNASGQVTSVTNTSIAINGSQVSGNISGSAGSVANSLTLGTYLTGGTYNGSAAVTATVDATSANTASKVVARDSSGNFSAGTITATLSGSATSATTATNLAGGAANQIAYQSGSGTTAFATAPSASNQVLSWNGSAFSWSAGTISGVPLGSNLNSLTAGTYLTGTAYNGSAAQTFAVDATSANTASKVVARDASGDFSAGTITAALSGNATTATTATTANALNTSNSYTTAGSYTSTKSTTGPGTSSAFFANGGDITAARTGNTGVVFLGTTGSNYLYFDGTTYNLNAAQLDINGSRALNAGNYNSYAPTLTGTGASGTWNINVTGSAGSATTLANFTATTAASGFNPDSPPTIDQIGYWYGGSTLYGYTDGGLYTSGYSTSWYHQISGDFRSGQIAVRGKNSGTWQSWNYIPTYSLNNGYSTGSLYAGIYYDANDTSYYADPSSTSSFNVIRSYALSYQGGVSTDNTWGIFFDSSLSTSYAIYRASGAWTSPYPDLRIAFHTGIQIGANAGYGGVRFYTDYDMATEVMSVNNSAVGLGASNVYVNNSLVAGSSLRAPIFYDSDNTAYYADLAAGTSLSVNGGITFAASNPSLSSPSYFVIPGGAYFNSGTVYMEANLKARGGVGDDNNAALTLTGGTSGYTNINGSARSPIFYDLNDTGYYVDPASNSRLFYLGVGNVTPDLPLSVNGAAQISSYLYMGGTAGYSGSWSGRMYSSGGATYINTSTFQVDRTGYSGGGSFSMDASGNSYASASFRAPIFYDSDDTAFYTDPANISSQKSICIGYNSASPYVYNVDSTGYITFGTTSDPASYAIKTELENYNGNYSKLRLKWYTGIQHYASEYYGGHRFYDINGTLYFGIGASGNWSYSVYSHRAPIFYDLDNTGYYVDPASGSQFSAVYADNWFRPQGQTGLYSQSYGQHLYPQNNGRYWSITGNGASDYGALLFKTNHESTIKGYVYWDTNGFGLLHGGGGWSVRGNLAGIGGQFYGSWFSDTDLRAPIFYDNDNTGYYVDPNSTSRMVQINFDNLYCAASTSYGFIGTSVYTDTINSGLAGDQLELNYVRGTYVSISHDSMRAPLFYDYDNTGYYVDPASTSILNVLNCYGNVTAYYSSDIKFKENVRDIPNALETVESIGGKLFDWNDEYMEDHGGEDAYFLRKEDFGVIAQDVQKVFPVAVRTRPDGSLAVDYEKLSALAFAAVAELSNRVKSLEARI